MPDPQTTSQLLMVRPAAFTFNTQTAPSNSFQTNLRIDPADAQVRALTEFDGVAAALESRGVNVTIIEDTPEPHTPDSVFPNNWVSFHQDGTAVLYPMMAENRRLEVRSDVLAILGNFRVIDLTSLVGEGSYLEGTGSLVLDRVNKVAYACRSPRTSQEAMERFGAELAYDVVAFEALGRDGSAIYHTNVVMSIGTAFAVLCTEAVAEPFRSVVLERLRATNREVIEISRGQMESFAGNMIEVADGDGNGLIVVSTSALRSLGQSERAKLARYGEIVHVDVSTIEGLSGGSVRCMIAEVFPAVSCPPRS